MYLRLAIVGLVGIGFCIFAMVMLQDVTKGLTRKGGGETHAAEERMEPARIQGNKTAFLPPGPFAAVLSPSTDPGDVVPASLAEHARREMVQVFTLRTGRRPTAPELEELVQGFQRAVLALPTQLVEARVSSDSGDAAKGG